MMEAAVRAAGEGAGRTEGGEGKEGRLSLDFGHASSHLYHQQHHPKLLRSEAFPFRIASGCPSTDASAASDGRARSPSSPHTFAFPTNGGIGGGGGGTAVFSHGGVSDSHGTPRALQRPLVAPFDSPGLAGDATLQLCSAFTAAQWQELHRQALIFKYIIASAPVPPELLFSPRPFPDVPPMLNLGRGGDYLHLRFTAGAGGDLEPGRCRRTDGKKWRCSRDVTPGQKYCERHVHRARPRSRKPVELDRGAGPAAANAAEAVSATSGAMNHTTPTATAGSSSAAARPCTPSSPGLLPSGGDLKFPFQFMVPQDRKLRSLGSSAGGDAEAQAATPQWQLLHSKMGLRGTTSVLQQQQHEDDQLNLNCNSLSDHHDCPFPSTDISSLEDLPVPHDRRGTPRPFIDAWSRSHNPFHGVTDKDNHRSTDSGAGRISFRTPGNLSPSNLTLSMSGTCGGGGGEDQVHFQMGIRAADSGRMLAPSWMCPGSPIGGPLAEVLQTTSTSTVSFRNERAGAGRENDAARGGAGLIIDLMSKTGCDSSEGTSPREGGPARGFPSPTRVLQRALVSLSDSSSNSSLTFGAGPGPDLGLQWASPSN